MIDPAAHPPPSSAAAYLWNLQWWQGRITDEMMALVQSVPACILESAYWADVARGYCPQLSVIVAVFDDPHGFPRASTLALRPLEASAEDGRWNHPGHTTVDMTLPQARTSAVPYTAWIETAEAGLSRQRLHERLCRGLSPCSLAPRWSFDADAFRFHIAYPKDEAR